MSSLLTNHNSGRLKGTFSALNINAIADNAVTVPFTKWKLARVEFHDASTTLATSLAVIGLFTAAAGGGTNLITSAVTGLTAAAASVSQTLGATTAYQTATTIYLRPTTVHGSAATLDVTLHFDDLA